MTRILLAGGAVAVAVVLFVVLRPEREPASSTAAQTSETTTGEATTEETTTTEPEEPVRIELVVRNGRPIGGVQRPEVAQGERVVIVVESDVADHVHLHGYDLMRDVTPGAPARIAFRAAIPGGFEVELEESHLLLAQIEVQP